jgi:hypothetical protein
VFRRRLGHHVTRCCFLCTRPFAVLLRIYQTLCTPPAAKPSWMMFCADIDDFASHSVPADVQDCPCPSVAADGAHQTT